MKSVVCHAHAEINTPFLIQHSRLTPAKEKYEGRGAGEHRPEENEEIRMGEIGGEGRGSAMVCVCVC